MNYFEDHIGDYAAATSHLTWDEDMAYTRLIRAYYHHEKPIPADFAAACRLARASTLKQKEAIKTVLHEFFKLEEDGWHQKRCDEEIARFKDKQAKAKRSAEVRWNQTRTHTEGNANASPDAMRTHTEGNAPIPIPSKKKKNFVESNVVTPPPVESLPPSPEHATRKGVLCKRLRAIGIDAAPHLPVWEETLLQFDDEAIIAVAEIAKARKPGERIHLNYLAPILTHPVSAQSQEGNHEAHQRDTRSRTKRVSDKLDEIARASIEREQAAAAGALDGGDLQAHPGEVWPPLDGGH